MNWSNERARRCKPEALDIKEQENVGEENKKKKNRKYQALILLFHSIYHSLSICLLLIFLSYIFLF
jgi:hypothetical protein